MYTPKSHNWMTRRVLPSNETWGQRRQIAALRNVKLAIYASGVRQHIQHVRWGGDYLCGLVVRGFGFDTRRFQNVSVKQRCANQRAARGRVLPASTTSNYSLQRHHGTTPIRTRRHQALEVIREEAVNEVCYTKRRKQLIPRARLAHWRAPSSTDSRRSSICSTQKRTEGKPCSQPTELRQPGNDIPENSYAEIELLEVPPAFRDETETSNIQHSESGTKPVNPGSSDLKTEHKSTESFKEAEKSFTYLREKKTVNLTSAAKNKQSFISNLNSSKIPSLKGNIEIIVDDRKEDAVKRKSPPMEKTHIPAFRAFSCSGQKKESQNDLSISRIVRAKISSESEIFDQSHSISKASTKKGYQTLEMSKVNVNEGIKLDDEYIHKKEKQMLHKDTSESTKSRALKSRKYSPDNKAAAFDGLLQYLQDYRHGLRELLVNNNVVIIEPIREHPGRMEHCSNHKIDGFANNGKANEPSNEKTCRITGATVKKSYSNENQDVSAMFSSTLPRQQKFQQPVLRRHFFYHPKRTNRELVDEELPNPDTVKNARQVFEKSLYHKGSGSDSGNNSSERNKPNSNPHEGTLNKIDKRRQIRYLTADTIPPQSLVLPRWTDTGSLSSGVSSDLSYDPDIDLSSPRGNILSRNSNHHYDNLDVFSSDDNDNSEEKRNCYSDDEDDDGDAGGHYVPPEVLDKIRACGTSVTYYGGHVIASTKGPLMSPMTLAIMDEIRKNNSSTRKKIFRNNYLGVKFRLVKSNSCGSRLELAGTEEGDKYQSEMEKLKAPRERSCASMRVQQVALELGMRHYTPQPLGARQQNIPQLIVNSSPDHLEMGIRSEGHH
uniref:Uncharacterized protein n=1 Tax=Timema tahoe TaxID=61484 RepID=A0A7R9IPE1_9NEOP|nr:unnamed protein product [Timema tahoe]